MVDNLTLEQIAPGQSQKEASSNLADSQLMQALTEVLAVDMSGGNVTLTTLQMQRSVTFSVSGQTASRDLTIGAVKRGIFVVENTSATYPVVVKRGSTSITVDALDSATFKTDGTSNNLVLVGQTRQSTGSVPYDIGFFVAGQPGASAVCARFKAVRSVILPINLTGSQADAITASSGSVAYDIQVNGISKGSVTYATSATGTFTFPNAVTLAAGDVLSLVGPGVQDATLADCSITFKATR